MTQLTSRAAVQTPPRDATAQGDGVGARVAGDVLPTSSRSFRLPQGWSVTSLWPGLTALVVCLLWGFVDWRDIAQPPPFEDAAMLFKYAENLGHGFGITWNAGEAPGLTDGATDLGFVLTLAPFTWLGIPVGVAALVANLAAVFGVGALFGVLNRRLWQQPPWVPIAAAALVASGPTCRYVLAGYSPPVMGFLLLLSFVLAAVGARALTDRRSLLLVSAAGMAAGLSGWWRPEGFVFGPLVVVAALLIAMPTEGWKHAVLRRFAVFLTPFAILVLAWVFVRIVYFGQLLPTSAVMKTGSVHPLNALYSVQFYGALLLPLIGILVVAAVRDARARTWWLTAAVLVSSLIWINAAVQPSTWEERGLGVVPMLSDLATVVIFIPILIVIAVRGLRRRDRLWVFPVALMTFSIAWVAIATTLNHWGRMQWPLVPVLAGIGIASAALATGREAAPVHRRSNPAHTPVAVVVLLACVAVLPFAASGDYRQYGVFYNFHNTVSSALKTVDTSTVRLATTEAGLIPLAVMGPSLDTWGHNNRSIATTHGGSLRAELTAFSPNMIALHGLPPPWVRPSDCPQPQSYSPNPFEADWSQMVSTMYDYAREHGIALARISETHPCETWSLWMSPDVDPRIRKVIQQIEMPGTEFSVSGQSVLRR